MFLKGQSSIEYLAVVGIGLLMATPFIGLVQEEVFGLRTDSQDARFVSSLDEMESAIERAHALGEPAQSDFVLNVPDNIVFAEVIDNRSIVFTQNRSGKLTNYTRIFENDVSAVNLPTERGKYRFTAKASENRVELEYGAFVVDFSSLDPVVEGSEATFSDQSQLSRKTIVTREWLVNGTLEQTGSDTFSYTFGDSQLYNITLRLENDDGEIESVSKLYQPEQSETVAFSLQTQNEWNKGYFNLTSADRNNNSGNLGLGYLNGSNPSASSFEEGLVGYWRMDRAVSGSGGTVRDYSGEANDGVTNGGVSTGVNGIFESDSMSFTSGEDIDVQSDSTLEGMDSLALSAWIKPNSLGKDYFVLGGKNLYEIVLDDGSNRCNSGQNLWWAVENGDGDWTINCEDITIPTNSWTHVALVSDFSSDEIRIYKNGQLEVTNSGTGSVSSNGNPIGIAQRPDGFGSFDGKIDEAKVYNRSLSDKQVQNLYFNGEPFKGNYTSKVIENADTQNWKRLEIQASINSTTDDLTATFETLKDSLLYTAEQAYSSVTEWNQGDFNKTTADEVITEYNYPSEFDASTQSGFNQGEFNGTSADRKDNSGDLGLGYLNDTSNLDAYYRFDRDVNPSGGILKDYSGNGNDLTYTGTSTPGSKGVFSTNSTDWDGSSAADSSNVDFTINQTNEASVALWIYGDPSAQPQQNTNFRAIDSSGNRQLNTHIPWDNGNVYWDTAGDYNRIYTSVDSSKWEGKWNFWVFRHDSSTGNMDMYVNNQLVTSSSSQTATYENIQELSVGASPGVGTPYDGRMDELMIFNDYISMQTMEEIYIHGGDGVFEGSYIAKEIDNSEQTNWDSLESNASIPSNTSVNATFRALDSSGNLVDSQNIDLSEGLNNYSLSVSSSEDAKVLINGTSSNVTKSWEIHSLEVFSSEVEDKIEGLRIGYRNGSTGDDLVGYWRMDREINGDGGIVRDYSGEGNEGIAEGNLSSGVEGVLGSNAFEFDGSDDFVFNDKDSGVYDFEAPASYSFWAKTSDSSGQYFGILGSHESSSPYNGWAIANDNGQISLWTDQSSWQSTGVNIADGNWHHYTAVIDGSEFKLYKDGVLERTLSYTPPSNEDVPFYIADRNDLEGNPFEGSLDEIRIYNRTLSESEIKDLYFNGRPFRGNYTAEKNDNSVDTSWSKIEINASVPSDTSLTAEYEALDSSDNVVDREYISMDSGSNTRNYTLNVQASEGARLSFNGTSSNVTKTWNVYGYKVYSGEREVDESESFNVQDGLNEFSLGVSDSEDARIKLNGTSSDITQSWSVSNMSVFTE